MNERYMCARDLLSACTHSVCASSAAWARIAHKPLCLLSCLCCADEHNYIKTFAVRFLPGNDRPWEWVKESSADTPTQFTVDARKHGAVKFGESYKATQVRLYPLEWQGAMAMRSGLLLKPDKDSEASVNYFKRLFKSIDTSGDDYVDKEELTAYINALTNSDAASTDSPTSLLLKKIDGVGSREGITYPDFKHHVRTLYSDSIERPEEFYWKMYSALDKDKDGFISKHELAKHMEDNRNGGGGKS